MSINTTVTVNTTEPVAGCADAGTWNDACPTLLPQSTNSSSATYVELPPFESSNATSSTLASSTAASPYPSGLLPTVPDFASLSNNNKHKLDISAIFYLVFYGVLAAFFLYITVWILSKACVHSGPGGVPEEMEDEEARLVGDSSGPKRRTGMAEVTNAGYPAAAAAEDQKQWQVNYGSDDDEEMEEKPWEVKYDIGRGERRRKSSKRSSSRKGERGRK